MPSTGDHSTRGGVQPGYQLTGPLGTALSMGTGGSQQQPGGFFKETVHEVRQHILCVWVWVL